MEKQIALKSKTLIYALRRSSRARRVRLSVYGDGSIVLTVPFDLNETMAETFIREKREWLFSKISLFKRFQGRRIVRYTKKHYLEHKENALTLVQAKLARFNTLYGYEYKGVKIKHQKTCWGSCSQKYNLNFNYKILFLPENLQNYVIVHELCHLKELNHSKKFWSLVAETMPDYRESRKELKSYRVDSLIIE